MGDDIVVVLRQRCAGMGETRRLLGAAADEIERLRADLEEAYDACRYALADLPRWRENAATVVAEWEARRG